MSNFYSRLHPLPIRPALQRRAGPGRDLAGLTTLVPAALSTPGRPLDPATRARMESRFGHDFGRVRVHTGALAAESARLVGALAYTVGREVVFGAGQYAPGSAAGLRLIAHELAHVVQQGGAAFQPGAGLRLAPTATPLEDQARAAARPGGGRLPPTPGSPAAQIVQRAVSEAGLPAAAGGDRSAEQACAGWYSDRESTTKRAAELYVRTELAGDRGVVERIECDLSGSDGRFGCVAHFTDGTPIRVFVRPDVIIVSVHPVQSMTPPADRPLCWYDYACPGPDRDLVLTKRKCDSSASAGTPPPGGGRKGPNP